VVSFLLVFPPKPYRHSFFLPPVLHAPKSTSNFLQPPVISSLLDPNILLGTLFSNTISPCSFLNAREQVIHPSHISLKIIKMYTCSICIGTELLHIFKENMLNHPWQQAKSFLTFYTLYKNTKFSVYPHFRILIILFHAHHKSTGPNK
jgi:hypothetical protein